MKPWTQTVESVVFEQKTDTIKGLASDEAAARLNQHGPNELQEAGRRSVAAMLFEQFSATMVVILLIAAIVSLFIGKQLEAVSIFIIVIMFGLLGFFQDYRAEKAMAALKKMSKPKVRVRRGGEIKEIDATNLVPGDMVVIENGNIIPADGRLVECVSCQVQESILTGESESVEKHLTVIDDDAAGPGDRKNMVFMGTTVSSGRGAFVVTGTGMNTELGKIAAMLTSVEQTKTPLQIRLDKAGKLLAAIGGVVAVIIAGAGLVRGESVSDMFLLAISVAVAVIPEGLPAVVTITLAIGARRMFRRNALIRRLPAVETLGSVTHICSDKTGTLTENRMTMVASYVPMATDRVVDFDDAAKIDPLLICGALCNDARISKDEHGEYRMIGDATEGALVVAADKAGMAHGELLELFPRVGEFAFDSDRKRMTTVHSVTEAARQRFPGMAHYLEGADEVAFVKGSPDGILETASQILMPEGAVPIDEQTRTAVLNANDLLASQGKRVLAGAFRALPKNWRSEMAEVNQMEAQLSFIGLFALIDPPRTEVRDAIAVCKSAGINVFMITGDHPTTARAISRELALDAGEEAVTGRELGDFSDATLNERLKHVRVFARVSPEHKIRIVTALQSQGAVVSMTGDGVNDAPALKKADIGVAMGITGTDVSKEASDMVLQDDNFTTIVAAVEEGRVIYDNIRKFIKFSIAGNLGKIIAVSIAPFLSLFFMAFIGSEGAAFSIAVTPLQLLWLNLLTDGLLGVGLGVEPGESGVMKRKPVNPSAGVFSGGVIGQILRMGTVIGVVSMATGLWFWHQGAAGWQTILFSTLAFAQIFQAIGTRSASESIVAVGLFSNPTMAGILALVTVLQLCGIYLPPMQKFLGTTAISAIELAISFGAASLVLLFAEIEKKLFPMSPNVAQYRSASPSVV
ncbi:MAG: cation-translocating P-type ATPase [Deltaproteobacteria bacterium]|nr:cation-translocating P-type ATPase [Deltaproteobacteria bacterium]